jgi:hypothetical protein
MTKTLTTILHVYLFDLNLAGEREAYDALRKRLQEEPGRGHPMTAFGDYRATGKPLDGKTIELDATHLFDNQWNTVPGCGSEEGLRLFDWAETPVASKAETARGNYPRGMVPNNIRSGYYLDMTPEIVAARAGTVACGYCGAQYAKAEAPADGFCERCMGGPHLKADELHLLRLRPVTRTVTPRAPLTLTEEGALKPRYVQAQLYGNKVRTEEAAAKARARVEKLVSEATDKAAKLIKQAEEERDGKLWLLDRGLSIENVIYYGHTGRFHFGWQGKEGLSDEVVSSLLDVISEFPAPYDISTDPNGMHQGRKLSGD